MQLFTLLLKPSLEEINMFMQSPSLKKNFPQSLISLPTTLYPLLILAPWKNSHHTAAWGKGEGLMEGYPSNSTWPKTTLHVFLLPESQSILVLGLHSWSWNTGFALHISFKFMQAISFPFLPGIIFWAHSCLHFLSNKQALIFHESYDITTSFKPFLSPAISQGELSLLCVPTLCRLKTTTLGLPWWRSGWESAC